MQLLQSPVVAAIVDEVTVRTLASWFQCEELASVKLLLRAVEILVRHEHTVSRPGRGRDPRGPGGPECPVVDGVGPPLRIRPRKSSCSQPAEDRARDVSPCCSHPPSEGKRRLS